MHEFGGVFCAAHQAGALDLVRVSAKEEGVRGYPYAKFRGLLGCVVRRVTPKV